MDARVPVDRPMTAKRPHLLAAIPSVLFLVVGSNGLYGCLMVVGILTHGDIGGPLNLILIPVLSCFHAMGMTGVALLLCLAGEWVLRRWLTHWLLVCVPATVLLAILTASVGVIASLALPAPLLGAYAELQEVALCLCAVAWAVVAPPLTYWVFLRLLQKRSAASGGEVGHRVP
jgi:hypothetical protein